MALKNALKVKCRGTCGRTIVANPMNFYKTKNKDCEKYDNFYPMCKKCLNERLVNTGGMVVESKFIEVCKLLDIPFVEDIFNEVKGDNATLEEQNKIMGEYKTKLNTNSKYKNMTYSQKFEREKDPIKEQIENIEVTDEMLAFWGGEVEPRLCRIYQKEYDSLCIQDGGNITPIKQNYFKNLAMLTYTAQEQLINNDYKGYEATMRTYTSICEKCGLNPKQIQDRDDSNRGTFGVFIRMIEDERPLLDPERDLGTVDMVRRCLEVFFFGHMAEVCGFRNPLKCKYDETMGEYTVKTDTYEDLANIEENDEEIKAKNLFARFKVKKRQTKKLSLNKRVGEGNGK